MAPIKAGIDAGGSLLKMVYEENKQLHYKKYPIQDWKAAIQWLKFLNPTLKVALTGGKAHLIQQSYFSEATIVPEFQATCEGARMFLLEEGHKMNRSYLLVNIGTGTSWHLVNDEKYERILGSGIGGGTLMGLGSLLTHTEEFQQLISLAENGDKGNVDLLVKDIYESSEAPIDGHLTAANFAKGLSVKHTHADRMASVLNMIAETIILLTLQAAAIHRVKQVVFIGSTLIGNDKLKAGLDFYAEKLGLTAIYIEKGEYCGAAGALQSF